MRILQMTFLTLFSAASLAQAQIDEKVVVCQNHEILLTARGDIAVVDKDHQVQLYLPILHEKQLIQNDSQGLTLTGERKRLGMILSQQKVRIDYRTGQGTVEDLNVSGASAPKRIELKSCRKIG